MNIIEAIRTFPSFVSGGSTIAFRPNEKGTELMCFNATSLVSFQSEDGLCADEKTMTSPSENVLDACKKVGTNSLSIKDNILTVLSKNSKIEILLRESELEHSIPSPSKESLKIILTEDHILSLSTYLDLVSIEKLYAAQMDPRLIIHATDTSLLLLVHDDFQTAFVKVKNDFGLKGTTAISYPTFKSIIQTFKRSKSEKTALYITEETIIFKSGLIKGCVQLPSMVNSLSVDQVVSSLPSLSFNEECYAEFEVEVVKNFLDSCRGISAEDTRVNFESAMKKTNLVLNSSFGSGQIQIKNKNGAGAFKFAIEFRVLKSLVQTSKTETVKVSYSDGILFSKMGPLNYVSVVSES